MESNNSLLSIIVAGIEQLQTTMVTINIFLKQRQLDGAVPGRGEPKYWVYNVWPLLETLCTTEVDMYKSMREVSGRRALQSHCKRFLEVDLEPQANKVNLGDVYSTRAEAELKRQMRRVVLMHRHLVAQLEGAYAGTVRSLKFQSHVQSIKAVLDELRWLFGVFVCYSHKDARVVKRVIRVVKKQLEGTGIDIWRDREDRRRAFSCIPPGRDYRNELMEHIEERDAALVFQSEGFRQSKFIADHEYPKLEKRHRTGQMLVIPVVVSEDGLMRDWVEQRRLQRVPSEGELESVLIVKKPRKTRPRSDREFKELCITQVAQPIAAYYGRDIVPAIGKRNGFARSLAPGVRSGNRERA